MNGAEILQDIRTLTRLEEAKGRKDCAVNPEVFAMQAILPSLSPRWVDFVKRRMAFDLVHLSEPRLEGITRDEWLDLRVDVDEYLPKVPRDIGALPSGWRRVFREVMQLYGNPDGK